MADLKEEIKWENGIYQIETTDPVVGGVDGISNKQAKQLANRTSYLKKQVEDNKSGADLALATKRDVNDSYSKLEVDKKFTDTGKLIEEKLGKSEATPAAMPNTIAERDQNGDFSARDITVRRVKIQADTESSLFSKNSELFFRQGGGSDSGALIRAVNFVEALKAPGGVLATQYRDVGAERASGAIYTNTTQKPLWVNMCVRARAGDSVDIKVYVNEKRVQFLYIPRIGNYSPAQTTSFCVLPGSTFRIDFDGNLQFWYEMF